MNVITAGDIHLLSNIPADTIPVLLYAPRGSAPHGATIGSGLVQAIEELPAQPSLTAFDFLTIALSVIAADTFVRRDDAPNRWTRTININIAVATPEPWQPIKNDLEKALGFLSGDTWHLQIAGGGPTCPLSVNQLAVENCACLFSGGLDSTLGSIRLQATGNRPLLVSQAYPREGSVQRALATIFAQPLHHFIGNADPQFNGRNETSMRARSLLFLAYGVLSASSLANYGVPTPVNLFIPENGLIALNAPLTRRRLGSHSTRTTHPWFLAKIQQILNSLNIPVLISNPFEFNTKGEIMRTSPLPDLLRAHASRTISCGKWKRKRIQCGRCLPCLIRRAAFHHSGIPDTTPYRFPNLLEVKNNPAEHDDLLALCLALRKMESSNIDGWIATGGPLPEETEPRQRYIDVFRRGMEEIKAFLISQQCY